MVYPHLRGADSACAGPTRRRAGVSPPAWGRPVGPVPRGARVRCIPTCVGQTPGSSCFSIAHKVYPHLRGADTVNHDLITHHTGVSPPAWGRPELPEGGYDGVRCIPTCVGQTVWAKRSAVLVRVYPHLRGADDCLHLLELCCIGVSPPAWGRQLPETDPYWFRRCIPTCVGQTAPVGVISRKIGVYPHLRGADG